MHRLQRVRLGPDHGAFRTPMVLDRILAHAEDDAAATTAGTA
ncbi:hypothetical protein [Streptosporangium roseum]